LAVFFGGKWDVEKSKHIRGGKRGSVFKGGGGLWEKKAFGGGGGGGCRKYSNPKILV